MLEAGDSRGMGRTRGFGWELEDGKLAEHRWASVQWNFKTSEHQTHRVVGATEKGPRKFLSSKKQHTGLHLNNFRFNIQNT